MLIEIYTLVLLLSVRNSRCSLVMDAARHGLHLSDYCPKMEFCDEGAHVMCMYYDPKREMGPQCSNPKNITMTPELATKLLDVTNAVRSKIALGKEKGKNGLLPRGYGIFRLSWDEELATFAQVLANQCVLRHDLCRATKKFPNPGQATGLVRFTYPDWFPVSKKSHFTTTGLTPSKLNYAITQTLKGWYGQKALVTQDMILSYPDWVLHPNDQGGRLYLEMINGPATHMGCGVSAYTQYAYHDNNAPLNYNSVQVICNFSAKPHAGSPVYTTSPPTEVGFTVKCGCPIGYDEDADCLCFESPKPETPALKTESQFCTDGNCKPTVVLLPIFTVEDAPPHKLLSPSTNYTTLRQPLEIPTQNQNYKTNTRITEPQSLSEFTKLLRQSDSMDVRYHQSKGSKDYGRIQNPLKEIPPAMSLTRFSPPLQKRSQKRNIFARAEKFKLPKKSNSFQGVGKEIKKDVPPRKDFGNVQKLVQTYLNTRRHRVGNISLVDKYEYGPNEPLKSKEILDHTIASNVLNVDKVSHTNSYFQRKSNYKSNITKHILEVTESPDDAEKKLMTLLDNLEKEVKYIELKPLDKEIFDAKLRKIYDTVIGKRRDYKLESTHLEPNNKNLVNEIYDNLINYENAADIEFKDNRRITDREIKYIDSKKLQGRNQNSIRIENKHFNNIESPNIVDNNMKEAVINDDRKRIPEDWDDRNRLKNLFVRSNINENALSYGRRKFYQEKLDNLERQLQSFKNNQRRQRAHPQRAVRPVLPTGRKEVQIRPSKTKEVNSFYIPDKARFIHGF